MLAPLKTPRTQSRPLSSLVPLTQLLPNPHSHRPEDGGVSWGWTLKALTGSPHLVIMF